MKVAWFRPNRPDVPNHWGGDFDDLAAVIDALAPTHSVEVVDARHAHDFVWQWARGAFDLCVYELDNTPAHQYLWPYLLHYPGVLALRTSTVHDSRAAALIRERRHDDYAAEIAFAEGPRRLEPPWHLARGAWPMWRIPVLASRLTAVADEGLAGTIRRACPEARVAWAPTGVPGPEPALPIEHGALAPESPLRLGVADAASVALVERAAARARRAGAAVQIVGHHDPVRLVHEADVIVDTRWPTLGRPLSTAVLGAAAGRVVIVAETESTAGWPALDPQTWQGRAVAAAGGSDEPAMAISIDPRDEEHSLMLALTRVASDGALRRALGTAARAWWVRQGTVAHAVAAWRVILDEAVALDAAPRPPGWPRHLDDDGSRLATALLAELGVAPDWSHLP
jgi:hypothetical protein